MLMACKVARCAELARAALAQGMAAVVGLQSGEANMDQVRQVEGDELDDLVSSPQVQISNFIAKSFPERHIRSEINESHLDLLVLRIGASPQNPQPLVLECLSDEAGQEDGRDLNTVQTSHPLRMPATGPVSALHVPFLFLIYGLALVAGLWKQAVCKGLQHMGWSPQQAVKEAS